MNFHTRSWCGLLVVMLAGFAAGEEAHWSFKPPRRPALPAVGDSVWPTNPIDAFTLAKMRTASLTPSPRADRMTLLRRVTLDLTGLPPTIAERDRYEFLPEPIGYRQLVDRLLASPQFGERLAIVWLDAARYADTHGFLIDSHRDMWRWRDWVVDAFNRNQPFDQFTIEQLAGDLLPDPSLEQLLATGFNRNHMINYENGAEEEEYRVEYVADRAATTANVWLGLTFQCARCHDHKYDPLTMREYYEWFAFFNNVEEIGLDGNVGNAPPVIVAPTPEQQRQVAELDARLALIEQSLKAKRQQALATIDQWEPGLNAHHRTAARPGDAALRVSFDQPEDIARGAPDEVLAGGVRGEARWVDRQGGRALISDGDLGIDFPAAKWTEPSRGLTVAAWVFPTTADAGDLLSLRDQAGRTNWALSLVERTPAIRIPTANDDQLYFRAAEPLAQRRWQHVAVSWDGAFGGELQWFLDGRAIGKIRLETALARPLGADSSWTVGNSGLSVAGFRGLLDDVAVYPRELTAEQVAALADADPVQIALSTPHAQRNEGATATLVDAYLQGSDPAFRRLAEEAEQVRRQRTELRRASPTAMVMRERAERRPTFILRRGKFHLPGDSVEPAVPQFLGGWPPETARHDRLGLAQWLVAPSNPLTARVMVNRLWQMLFGAGLVRSPEDWGVRGERPTHPELLDWLAVEFIESGWDVKHIVRLIVNSETYRQSSRVTENLLAADPENRWLARAPRLRLDAEAIRDAALSVSGLLDPRLGGPSVFPLQPAGLWEEVSYKANFTAQEYAPSKGSDLYRRSVYSFWKRTLPPPLMTIFDAPTRETCVVARSRSNTPLQALVLMNEPTLVEAARQLAARVLAESGETTAVRADYLFQCVLTRKPTLGERQELMQLFEQQRARFAAESQRAAQLLAGRENLWPAEADAITFAAWTVVANLTLSLDEAITRN